MKTFSFMFVSIIVALCYVLNAPLAAQEVPENWILPTDDAFTYFNTVTGAGGDENHNEWRLRVRSHLSATSGHSRDIYIKFSFEGTNYLFPEDVKTAYLKLTLVRWLNQRSDFFGTFAVYGVNDNTWDETTLTWNNAPWSKSNAGPEIGRLLENIDQIGSSDPTRRVVLDITDYVRDQLSQGNSTFSIVLSDTTYGTTNYNGTDARIFSKDALDPVIGEDATKDPTAFDLPYLVVNDANPLFDGFERVLVADDAFVYFNAVTGAGGDENHNEYRLRIRSQLSATNGHSRDIYIKFSLDGTIYSFPEDVDKVYLHLMAERFIGGNTSFKAWDVGDNSWTETTLTWNNAPWSKDRALAEPAIFESPVYPQMTGDAPAKPVWYDITDYVKNQLGQGNTTFGIVLSDTSYGTPSATNTDIRIFAKDVLDPAFNAPQDKEPDSTFIPAIFVKGPNTPTAVQEQDSVLPSSFTVLQNYPNPFNPETRISFTLSKMSKVKISVFDILGREIKNLLNEIATAGNHYVNWNGVNDAGQQVSSGIYFAKVKAENQAKTIKMLLVR